VAGLDGVFSQPGVLDWPVLSKRLAHEAASLLTGKVKEIDGLHAFNVGGPRWAVVVHPFWSLEAVKRAKSHVESFGLEHDLRFVTTFDLSRRMGYALARLREDSI
jgi:DEAD/DEAH box helicase domain-containing protein